MRIAKFMALGLLISAIAAGSALAFHDGGVAECAGCHTIHNLQDGVPVDAANPAGNAYLLKAGSSTDTCLGCHNGYGQMSGGDGYGPGGDFYWVTKTYTWTAHGHVSSSEGDSHGHNVISPTYGILEDATLGTAPGGNFDSSYLGCSSCHDPHGNQNFRLLYDDANPGVYGPIYVAGGRYNFSEAAPLAIGNSFYTTNPGGAESNSSHTIYKSGMADWCANCHGDIHSAETTNIVHETGTGLGAGYAGAYNAYVSSDDLTGGAQATAYWGLVPFEDVDADTTGGYNMLRGPDAADQVTCITCHRAHASPFGDIARWDMSETFIEDSHPLATDGGVGVNDRTNMYYNYTFVLNQRSLCNKCHGKDVYDSPY
jgi:hypothetical protein